MGKHVIIGRGNLGIDLAQALSEKGHEARILTRSDGFDWRLDIPKLTQADFVWIAAGFGSVEQTKRDPQGAFDTHVLMPVGIASAARPETRVIAFSSDYAADEEAPWSPGSTNTKPRSIYAVTKISMELALRALGRKNTFSVRVCSLYGDSFPSHTFPGRILSRYPNPGIVPLPQNRTTPTPTKWVADVLSRHLESFDGEYRTYHCAPMGMISVAEWGRIVLGSGYQVDVTGLDPTRPLCSNLQCSFEDAPDWLALWRLHWFQQQYHAPRTSQPSF
jgi:dTDP-4-dehydrorhamnose reductase